MEPRVRHALFPSASVEAAGYADAAPVVGCLLVEAKMDRRRGGDTYSRDHGGKNGTASAPASLPACAHWPGPGARGWVTTEY